MSDHNNNNHSNRSGSQASSWISQGFEQLVSQCAQHKTHDFGYDVVIVGSGYGGSIAAAELSGYEHHGQAVSVCVLERGEEYLAGMFPSRMADLVGHVRVSTPKSSEPKGVREGLFDLHFDDDLTTIVASGLGGGSLINAAVMEVPLDDVFESHWPGPIKQDAQRNDYYQRAKQLLGATTGPDTAAANTIKLHPEPLPDKFKALQTLAAGQTAGDRATTAGFRPAAITVAMSDKRNAAGVPLNQCARCGDCATGCNHGAKDSLDLNLLAKAFQQGAEIYTGATVLRIEQAEASDDWLLHVTYTNQTLSQRHGKPVVLRAGKIILAAGTLGSTEILLKSKTDKLWFSDQLGQRFSANGDMIAAGYDQNQTVNAVADETELPTERHIGPTITGVIDLRTGKHRKGVLIEEMAVPGPLRQLFAELYTTADTLDELGSIDRKTHQRGHPYHDPFAVNPKAMRHTSVLAVMGNDDAEGQLVLDDKHTDSLTDGAIKVRWPTLSKHKIFQTQISQLKGLLKRSKMGGKLLANPVWQLLPDAMKFLLGQAAGPALTVHPLGGCPMGDDIEQGVVDHLGRVFKPVAKGHSEPTDTQSYYPGLVVLDGAMIPTALGTNPALTIAAMSLRAVEGLREAWQFKRSGNEKAQAGSDEAELKTAQPGRPVYRDMSQPMASQPTTAEFAERLTGKVTLAGADEQPVACVMELTLFFAPKPLRDLYSTNHKGQLRDPQLHTHAKDADKQSYIRIFAEAEWSRIQRLNLSRSKREQMLDQQALWAAPVSGTLSIFAREPSRFSQRLGNSLGAWWLNRGMRDLWQSVAARFSDHSLAQPAQPAYLWSRLKGLFSLASHAGEVRLMDYNLRLGAGHSSRSDSPVLLKPIPIDALLHGVKRITYQRRANPWRQLSEVSLSEFPGMLTDNKMPVLAMDMKFMAGYGAPLLQIVEQQDEPTALAELAALAGFITRMLVTIHVWSFRQPDLPEPRNIKRLPGKLSGVAAPVTHELPLDTLADGQPVTALLTRYPNTDSTQPPLLMIHGYGASGTTYAHTSVDPNMAGYYWRRGRDVWVLDMRTSVGQDTSMHDWSFEDVAHADIPLAVDHVYQATGQQVAVVAHCMGAAMFSMAVLSAADVADGEPLCEMHRMLPKRIHNAVLSQVGPAIVFGANNIFSAYLASYLKEYLPVNQYRFRTANTPSLGEQLFDRLLSTLPYSDAEFDLENPPRPWRRTPYAGARHRLDALYGQSFNLANLSRATLTHFDDLFGPLSLETVYQASHFARLQTITDNRGHNRYMFRRNLQQCWTFPTFSIHGEDNKIADVATINRMESLFQQAGITLKTQVFKGFGHQDLLIGRGAEKVFQAIDHFYDECLAGGEESGGADADITLNPIKTAALKLPPLLAKIPWAGPVVGGIYRQATTVQIPIMLGASPTLGMPELVALIPVTRQQGRFVASRHLNETAFEGIDRSLYLIHPKADEDGWIKLNMPTEMAEHAGDGVLVLLIYDRLAGLEAPTTGPQQPENLQSISRYPDYYRDYTPSPLSATEASTLPDNSDPLRAYINKTLGGDRLREAIDKTLQRPAVDLEPALVEYKHSQRKVGSELRFALGSCQYPAGILYHQLAYDSYRRLGERLDHADGHNQPEFVLLMGDQIYVDATAGLFDPLAKYDRYIRPYKRFYSHPQVRSVLRRLPSYTMLDDHEIINDWEMPEDAAHRQLYNDYLAHGKRYYLKFQRGLNVPQRPPAGDSPDPLWYHFTEQGIPFFMMDTRTERRRRTAQGVAGVAITSEAQMANLEQWLLKQQDTLGDVPKFIVSPSILLPRRLKAASGVAAALHSDSWDGYPHSLYRILSFIADHDIESVVFLSGDEHLSCVAEISIKDQQRGTSHRLVSIHSSALHAPFPVANSIPEQLLGDDVFDFSYTRRKPAAGSQQADNKPAEKHYQCEVETEFAAAGSGFTLLRAYQTQGAWHIHCEFDRASSEHAVSGTTSIELALAAD